MDGWEMLVCASPECYDEPVVAVEKEHAEPSDTKHNREHHPKHSGHKEHASSPRHAHTPSEPRSHAHATSDFKDGTQNCWNAPPLWEMLVCASPQCYDEPVAPAEEEHHPKHSGHKLRASAPRHAHAPSEPRSRAHATSDFKRGEPEMRIAAPYVGGGQGEDLADCFMDACGTSLSLVGLMPLRDEYEVAEFRRVIDVLISVKGHDALDLTVDTKGRSFLWHAVNAGDELATHALVAAGAAKSLARGRTTSATDPITLAEERGYTRLVETFLCNAHQRVSPAPPPLAPSSTPGSESHAFFKGEGG